MYILYYYYFESTISPLLVALKKPDYKHTKLIFEIEIFICKLKENTFHTKHDQASIEWVKFKAT